VVVIGAGPMGLLNLLVLKRRGARVLVCELDEARRAKARSLGADVVLEPAEGDFPSQVKALTDGRGADEEDLFAIAPAIDPAFAIASVRAPLASDEGGYTWFESRGVARPDAASLRTSITWLRGWLDSLDEGRPEPQHIYLLGFSAGMMMAGALVLDQPARYAGAVLLSGALPFDTDLSVTKHRLRDLDVFHAHGSFDTVIPAELVTRTENYLRDASGARLTSKRYPIAHGIADVESYLRPAAPEGLREGRIVYRVLDDLPYSMTRGRTVSLMLERVRSEMRFLAATSRSSISSKLNAGAWSSTPSALSSVTRIAKPSAMTHIPIAN